MSDAAQDLLTHIGEARFATILADPPWQFENRTGKMAPGTRSARMVDRTVAVSAFTFET
jgi:hypothetical protein